MNGFSFIAHSAREEEEEEEEEDEEEEEEEETVILEQLIEQQQTNYFYQDGFYQWGLIKRDFTWDDRGRKQLNIR